MRWSSCSISTITGANSMCFPERAAIVESGIQPFMAMSRCTAPEIEPDDIDELKEKMDAVWQLLSSFCQGAAAPTPGLFDSCESLLLSVKKRRD